MSTTKNNTLSNNLKSFRKTVLMVTMGTKLTYQKTLIFLVTSRTKMSLTNVFSLDQSNTILMEKSKAFFTLYQLISLGIKLSDFFTNLTLAKFEVTKKTFIFWDGFDMILDKFFRSSFKRLGKNLSILIYVLNKESSLTNPMSFNPTKLLTF
jgi:hypothetical protein